MRETIYDDIGKSYSSTRQQDPRIAALLHAALGNSRRIVNVGAGTGAYEPPSRNVIAVEPSATMLRQRPPGASPALQAVAEALPFADRSVDATLAVLTVNHWLDLGRSFSEIRRVARQRAVFLTWDPGSDGFWLTRDYLPSILRIDRRRYPRLERFRELGPVECSVVPVPHDCMDGFMAAFWKRPYMYLDPLYRNNMSAFAAVEPRELRSGLSRLMRDLSSGAWSRGHRDLLSRSDLDTGYRLVVCHLDRAADEAR